MLYVLAGVAALSVGSLAFMLIRRRREADVMEESEDTPRSAGEVEVPPMEFDENNEKAVVRKQLENMAKERPEDFAKLLRTWLAED